MFTVLLIDRDITARVRARQALERGGAAIVEAASAADGMTALQRLRPDLVLVDPGERDAVARIRRVSDVPLVVLSPRADESEKVSALRAGADDYVTKPFGSEELLARSEALIRRSRPAAAPATYSDGSVQIDFDAVEARVNGRRLELTPLEFRLLVAFTRHPGHVLSAERLLELAWGQSGSARQRVKVYVGYLRSKFRDAGVSAPIETVRGFGYRYRPAAARRAA